jgi:hypothetical protein
MGKVGACVFAMRVNALALLGQRTSLFIRLCRHSVLHGCYYEVELRPLEVHAVQEALSATTVTETKNHRPLNWLNGDGGVSYCLLNGTGGKGVDIFCALPLVNAGGGLLLYLDQRKMEATSLGSVSATRLLEKANIVPTCLPANSKIVRGLFSILASFDKDSDQLPRDCFVLSHLQHKAYHGTLWSHPACRPFVDVNFDNLSTLRLLKSVKSVAVMIISQRVCVQICVCGRVCSVAAKKAAQCQEKTLVVSLLIQTNELSELPLSFEKIELFFYQQSEKGRFRNMQHINSYKSRCH